MINIKAHCADELYKFTLDAVDVKGSDASPRGQRTKEVLGAHLVLTNPNANVVTIPQRNLNYQFMVAEWLWMLSGSNYVDLIEPFNKQIIMAADRGQFSFAGAYGPKLVEQLPYVLETLRADPESRQAVISIWRERPRATRDVPCTVSMQFFVRNDAVHMMTYMRSNDVWLGLPYDLFNFTQLQRLIAFWLNKSVGHYHHMVGSLHAYERNFDGIRSVVNSPYTNDTEQLPFRDTPVSKVLGLFVSLAANGRDHPLFDSWWAHWSEEVDKLPVQWGDYLRVLARRFLKSDTGFLAADAGRTSANIWDVTLNNPF